mmetsp:Transcript_38413/g.115110  ORF Transcript_38413/g.115110 Transcript_38413/m.115110 type:complete len:229 (-) Transcript_38413:2704-3390(-)
MTLGTAIWARTHHLRHFPRTVADKGLQILCPQQTNLLGHGPLEVVAIHVDLVQWQNVTQFGGQTSCKVVLVKIEVLQSYHIPHFSRYSSSQKVVVQIKIDQIGEPRRHLLRDAPRQSIESKSHVHHKLEVSKLGWKHSRQLVFSRTELDHITQVTNFRGYLPRQGIALIPLRAIRQRWPVETEHLEVPQLSYLRGNGSAEQILVEPEHLELCQVPHLRRDGPDHSVVG